MHIRKCKACKIPKPLTDFYKDRGSKLGHSYMCKKCFKQYQHDYNRRNRKLVSEKSRIKRQKIKQILVDENGGKCCICGYNRYFGNLHFHHRDPSKKEFHVTSTGIHKARKEAAKCILICAHCHGESHAGLITLPI